MPNFVSPVDGAKLFYQYHQPASRSAINVSPRANTKPLTLLFLHGWPMSSRMFDHLIEPLVETHGYPILAPDRRGFGNSEWGAGTGSGGWDTFVSDLTALLDSLALGDFAFVAASMGCAESLLSFLSSSESVRERCRGFVWIGPNMPYNLECEACPLAPKVEVWDSILEGLRAEDSKGFVEMQIQGVFRTDLGNVVPDSALRFYEGLVAEADPGAVQKTVAIFLKDMVEEVRRFAAKSESRPVMILHGDSDSGMPVECSGMVLREMIPWAELSIYENGGHGLYLTHSERLLQDLLKFLEGGLGKL